MAIPKPGSMTIEQFLVWQLRQDKLYELVDGMPLLPLKSMAGASSRHDRIVVNAIMSFGSRLRGKPCRPTTSDIGVRVRRSTGLRRPDMTIECGRPADKDMTAAEPRIVMEVLSPSTLNYDRFRKLEEYKQTETIKVVLLVDSETPTVTIHRRVGETWRSEVVEGVGTIIALSEIDVDIPLDELFETLTFSET